MIRNELLAQRIRLVAELQTRKGLGEFDANARTTLLILETLIENNQHMLDLDKKKIGHVHK